MSDSKFDLHEIRGLLIAFLAFIMINGIMVAAFAGGVAGDDLQSEVPEFTPEEERFDVDIVGDFPSGAQPDEKGGWTWNSSGAPSSYTTVDTIESGDGTITIQYREWDSSDGEIEVRFLDENGSVIDVWTEAGGGATGTAVGIGGNAPSDSWIVLDEDEWHYSMSGTAGGDGNVQWRLNPEDSGWLGISGFLSGLIMMGEILGWLFGSLIEIAVTVISSVVYGSLFMFDLMKFLFYGWSEVTMELVDGDNMLNTFLAMVVLAPTIGLMLYLFNGVIKIVKALPFT